MRPVHGALFARLRASLASFGLFFALYTAPAFAATPTTTTLTASSNNVVAGAVVTLTATVTNPGPVGQGKVLFCNASVSQCTQGRGLYGAVQLNSDGSAVLRLRFGSGVVNIQAKFTATRSNAGSTSLTSSIGVSSGPVYASSTSLAKAGSTGNYTLTGTVGGFGSGSLLGSVSFLDTSNGNAQVDSASLGSFSTSLSAPIPYSVGNGTTRALVADLNGDGILDVVEADYGDGTISVLLGNPDGTFQARHSYPAGSCSSPNWISMGDLNGDGIQDVVCNGQGNSTISVLLGNGDGSFRTGASYPLSIGPSSIAIGDFNGDGIQDLAVTGNTSSTVAILLGNGDGTFQPQTTYPIGTYANSVAIGDFNGDGNLDLVVANSGSNTISVLLGNGDGTFQPQTTYATGSWPDALAVADFDGDGHLDIVVGSYSSNTVGVFIGNGDGTFQSQRGYAASGPVDVGVADLNGDGRPDLVVANYSTNTIATLLGNGDGTFKTAVTSPSGRSPASIAFGDFNGDGMLDVITPNNGGTPTVSVLFGDQSATFRVTGFSVSGSGTHNVLATYTGDATHTSSQSPTVALTAIVKTTPTVSVSCSPNPLTYGSQDSNCTVTITGGSTPSGTVVWTINGGAWTSSSLFMGTDSESTFSTSTVGSYTVNVAYAGDGTHNPASGSTTLTINKASTVTTGYLTANPIVFGQAYYFSGNVDCNSNCGSIQYLMDGTVWYTDTLHSDGTYATGYSGATVGTHTIQVNYLGDAIHNPSSWGPATLMVNPTPTVTELSSSANPIAFGGAATFTALVDTGGIATPTGPVAFTSNGVSIGSGTVSTVTATNVLPYSSDGTKWTPWLSTITPNSDTAPDGTLSAFRLNYPGNGDSNLDIAIPVTIASPTKVYTFSVWLKAVSAPLATMSIELRNQAFTRISYCQIASLPTTWQRYTCTGTFSSSDTAVLPLVGGEGWLNTGQAGSIAVWGGQVEQSSTAGPYVATNGASATGTGGIATLTTNTLPAGTDTILATYAGDANTLTSTSNPLAQVITKAAATMSLVSSLNPSTYGDAVTFTVTATGVAGLGTPTGTVTVSDGGTVLGTVTLNASGTATQTIQTLTAGSHSLSAVYGGDADYK